MDIRSPSIEFVPLNQDVPRESDVEPRGSDAKTVSWGPVSKTYNFGESDGLLDAERQSASSVTARGDISSSNGIAPVTATLVPKGNEGGVWKSLCSVASKIASFFRSIMGSSDSSTSALPQQVKGASFSNPKEAIQDGAKQDGSPQNTNGFAAIQAENKKLATDFQHDLHTLNDVLLESKKTEFTAKLNQNLDKSNEMKATMFKELESSKTEAIQNKPKQEDPRQNTTCQLIISLHNENKELTRKIGSYADDSDKKNDAMAKRNKNYETIAQRKSTLPEGLKNALDKILSK